MSPCEVTVTMVIIKLAFLNVQAAEDVLSRIVENMDTQMQWNKAEKKVNYSILLRQHVSYLIQRLRPSLSLLGRSFRGWDTRHFKSSMTYPSTSPILMPRIILKSSNKDGDCDIK